MGVFISDCKGKQRGRRLGCPEGRGKGCVLLVCACQPSWLTPSPREDIGQRLLGAQTEWVTLAMYAGGPQRLQEGHLRHRPQA